MAFEIFWLLQEKEAESKETQDGLLSYVFKKSMGKGFTILALLIANIGQLVKLLKHSHENHMPPLEEYLLCVSIGLQVKVMGVESFNFRYYFTHI